MTTRLLRSILSGIRRVVITWSEWLVSVSIYGGGKRRSRSASAERGLRQSSRARNVSRKQKQRFRAMRFVKHLSRFVDSHWFPDFRITDEMVAAEAKRQSHGERHLTESEIALIEPLKDAQKWKEVTIDGLVEEMAEWWSNRWGWWYPMAAHLECERGTNDWIMRKALLEIRRRCEQDFLGFLIARGGCERYIAKIASGPTTLAAEERGSRNTTAQEANDGS